MNKAIIIEEAGLLSTVQDTGRIGFQQFGMPVGGAMDTLSLQLANMLVGNKRNAACIEVTLSGPVIRFAGAVRFAICGADLQPQLNQQAIHNNIMYTASSGDRLSFSGRKSGFRAYIAFAGGMDVPLVMGSRSTLLTAGLGGLNGRALQVGDIIDLLSDSHCKPLHNIPSFLFFPFNSRTTMRIMPGPEIHFFGFDALKSLLTTAYTISHHSNRMGYHLEGEIIPPIEGKGEIVSAAVPAGTIQITSGGNPIIMMSEGQTTGGYPRMATIATIDLPALSQLMPGESIRFSEIKLADARRFLGERGQLLQKLSPY
jgi:antagonist of KipI